MSLNIQCLVFINSDIFQGNESKLDRFCDTASFKNLKIVFSFSFNWFFVCRHLLRINSGINLICSDCSLIISIMMSWIQFNWWSNRNSTNNLWTTKRTCEDENYINIIWCNHAALGEVSTFQCTDYQKPPTERDKYDEGVGSDHLEKRKKTCLMEESCSSSENHPTAANLFWESRAMALHRLCCSTTAKADL